MTGSTGCGSGQTFARELGGWRSQSGVGPLSELALDVVVSSAGDDDFAVVVDLLCLVSRPQEVDEWEKPMSLDVTTAARRPTARVGL